MVNTVNILFDFAEVSVGQHYYWKCDSFLVNT
jgi:hypothetical protein